MNIPKTGIPVKRPHHEPGAMQNACRVTVLKSWPVGSFLENLAVLNDHQVVVCSHASNMLEIIDVDSSDEVRFIELDHSPSGIACLEDGHILVNTGVIGTPGFHILKINSDDGSKTVLATIEDALFLTAEAKIA